MLSRNSEVWGKLRQELCPDGEKEDEAAGRAKAFLEEETGSPGRGAADLPLLWLF